MAGGVSGAYAEFWLVPAKGKRGVTGNAVGCWARFGFGGRNCVRPTAK
jgi:hypothetical protein